MWDWASASPPPEPRAARATSVRRGARRRARPGRADPGALASVVAEKGYPAMTVGDIASRASISLSTFYANFADKEEAMLAAVDSGSAQMLATTLPAFRRATDWPHASAAPSARCSPFGRRARVHDAGRGRRLRRRQAGAGTARPVMAGWRRCSCPATNEAGRQPDRRRGDRRRDLLDDLRPGEPRRRREHERDRAAGHLLTLAPFIGAEEACAVANGDGRGR